MDTFHIVGCAYVSIEGHKSDQKSGGLPDNFADAGPCNLSILYEGGPDAKV